MEEIDGIRHEFQAIFGRSPQAITAAPGRVNLIGEHTDYNDGFVLPAAIHRRVVMAGRRRADSSVNLYSANFSQHSSFLLEDIRPSPDHPWSNYIRGVVFFLLNRWNSQTPSASPIHPFSDSPIHSFTDSPIHRFTHSPASMPGMDVLVSGDVPIGAGLSSSAAVEVAALTLCRVLGGFDLDTGAAARLCQRAENEFAGMNCGIMDQFISLAGQPEHALFLDCRSLEFRLVPLRFPELCLVAGDTRVRRGLVGSEYNTRRAQCEEGVRLIRAARPEVRALRDVTPDDIGTLPADLPPLVARRCRHVILENRRVLNAVEAAQAGDAARFGRLMVQSHQSLRDDYAVSCRELDVMVEAALAHGALGSRMTGAGFGGCTVSLVPAAAAEGFMAGVGAAYLAATGREAAFFRFTPAAGARVVWTDESGG